MSVAKKFKVVFKSGHIAIVKGPYFERAMVLGGYGSCGSMEVDYYEECAANTKEQNGHYRPTRKG